MPATWAVGGDHPVKTARALMWGAALVSPESGGLDQLLLMSPTRQEGTRMAWVCLPQRSQGLTSGNSVPRHHQLGHHLATTIAYAHPPTPLHLTRLPTCQYDPALPSVFGTLGTCMGNRSQADYHHREVPEIASSEHHCWTILADNPSVVAPA